MIEEAGTGLVGAIDLGGTKILSLVVDMLGEVHGVDERPTEAHRGPDAVLRRMVESLNAALREAGRGLTLEAVGVAAPVPLRSEIVNRELHPSGLGRCSADLSARLRAVAPLGDVAHRGGLSVKATPSA